MSIMKIAKIKDSNSKEYRKLVSGIYSQFENLYKTMDLYAITESFQILKDGSATSIYGARAMEIGRASCRERV